MVVAQTMGKARRSRCKSATMAHLHPFRVLVHYQCTFLLLLLLLILSTRGSRAAKGENVDITTESTCSSSSYIVHAKKNPFAVYSCDGPLSRMSADSFDRFLMKLPPLMDDDENIAQETESERCHSSPSLHTGPLPPAFDWRRESPSCISEVYMQGNCGGCFAFASAEEVESGACLAGAPLREYSVQQILSCDTSNQVGDQL